MRGQIGNFNLRDSGGNKQEFRQSTRNFGIVNGWRNRRKESQQVEARKTVEYFRKIGVAVEQNI